MQELAVLASRALTTQRYFTAIADNVANANTDGYRRVDLEFKETQSKAGNRAPISYVEDRAAYVDFTPGVMQETNNPLNVAIGGEGFFAVSVEGQTHYTRAGHFMINSEGTLITAEGNAVLDNSGGPIQFPPTAKHILIGRDGTIATEEGQLATLGLFTFAKEDLNKLQRAGRTGFIPQLGAAALPMENPQILQGKVEASNVDPVTEMTTMQMASKAYQNALQHIRGLEQLEERAIRNFGVQ